MKKEGRLHSTGGMEILHRAVTMILHCLFFSTVWRGEVMSDMVCAHAFFFILVPCFLHRGELCFFHVRNRGTYGNSRWKSWPLPYLWYGILKKLSWLCVLYLAHVEYCLRDDWWIQWILTFAVQSFLQHWNRCTLRGGVVVNFRGCAGTTLTVGWRSSCLFSFGTSFFVIENLFSFTFLVSVLAILRIFPCSLSPLLSPPFSLRLSFLQCISLPITMFIPILIIIIVATGFMLANRVPRHIPQRNMEMLVQRWNTFVNDSLIVDWLLLDSLLDLLS